jgi:hypothetical protein
MRVFISYSHHNKDTVARLHKDLVSHPRAPPLLEVWIDVKDMAIGIDLSLQMHQAISDADVVLLCLSPSYVGSKACMFEARLARALDKPTIPIVLDGQYPFESDEIIEVLGPGILRIEGPVDAERVVDSLPSAPISIDTGQVQPRHPGGSPGELEAREFIDREGLTEGDLENLKSVARDTPHLICDFLPRRLSLAGRLALMRVANEVETSRRP